MIIGNFPYTKEAYIPPADWPNIDSCPDGHIQLILSDTVLATYAFICTTTAGQYRINWGDGTTTLHDSGATAEHTYTSGTGQACSRGYTTFIVDITAADVGAGLTRFRITNHSLAQQDQHLGILGCVFNEAKLDRLMNAFYRGTSPITYCSRLEFVKILQGGSIIDTSFMCSYCYSLQSVTGLSSLTSVTNASSMFSGCYSLQNVTGLSSMTNVTYTGSMFQNCYSLQNVDVSGMTSVTSASSMFQNCYALQSIGGLIDLGSNGAGLNADTFANNCEQLLSINMQNTKLLKITCAGISTKQNKLTSLTFSPLSVFSGSSPQINIAYCAFDDVQLNTLFASLPTLSSKTINITGCTGAATCDRSIATAKGWTVTG